MNSNTFGMEGGRGGVKGQTPEEDVVFSNHGSLQKGQLYRRTCFKNAFPILDESE